MKPGTSGNRPDPIVFVPPVLMLLRVICPWDGGRSFLLGIRQGYDLVATVSQSNRPVAHRILLGSLTVCGIVLTSDSIQAIIRGIRLGFGAVQAIDSVVGSPIDRM